MTLGRAIGFSAAFHVVLLTAAPSNGWLAPRQKRFEVSYVAVAAVKPQVSNVAPKVRLPDPVQPLPAIPRAPESEPAPAAASSAAPATAPPPAVRPVSRPLTRDDIPAPRPAISSLPDKEFVFLDHKERVRKHLKSRLNYPAVISDGTVRLRVILGPEGSFKQAVVLETTDPRLATLAVQDAQRAAPYPHLPAKFRPRQLRYEFLVRYRPE